MHFTQYASSVHFVWNIFAYLKRNNLLRKTDQCGRVFMTGFKRCHLGTCQIVETEFCINERWWLMHSDHTHIPTFQIQMELNIKKSGLKYRFPMLNRFFYLTSLDLFVFSCWQVAMPANESVYITIEHSIIGETYFITSPPPILVFFITKIWFLKLSYFSIMSKLNHLYNAEKILYVIEHIRYGANNELKACPSIPWSLIYQSRFHQESKVIIIEDFAKLKTE